MRPPAHHLVPLTHPQQETLYAVVADRPAVEPPNPNSYESAGLVEPSIAGDEPGWTVLTQRCDLLRPYCMEPLVELARTTLADSDSASQARLNSPRLAWLCDHEDDRCWMVDLRQRVLLPKHLLLESRIVQPLADDRTRKQFRLRVSQRYGRDPVPDDIVELVQRPLKKVLSGSAPRIELASHFFAFLAIRDREEILLLALLDDDKSLQQATEAFEGILERFKKIPNTAKLARESTVLTAEQLSFDLWLRGWKLSLDEISYSRRAGEDHAQPRV